MKIIKSTKLSLVIWRRVTKNLWKIKWPVLLLWGKEYLRLLITSCSSFVWYFVVFFRLWRKLSIFFDKFIFQPNLQMHFCQMILFCGPWKNSAVWVTLIWNIIYWFHMITEIKYCLNKIGNENVSLNQVNYFYVSTAFGFFFMMSYCLSSFPSHWAECGICLGIT